MAYDYLLKDRIAKIRAQVSLRSFLAEELIAEHTERSDSVICPFHAEEDASCLIFDDGYYCMACGAKGDQLDWIMHTRHVSLLGAAAILEAEPIRLDVKAVTETRSRHAQEKAQAFDPTWVWRWHFALNEHPEALAYYRRRGLTDQSISRFTLGYGKRFAKDTHARYTIPRFWRGKLVGLKFRRADPEDRDRKYYGYPGFTQSGLWTPDGGETLRSGQSEQAVIVTEGEFDAMIACQLGYHGISPVSGSTGDTSWTSLIHVPFYVVLDNDPPRPRHDLGLRRDVLFRPGIEFGKNIRRVVPDCKIVRLPGRYKDLTEWYIDGHSAEEFQELLVAADLRLKQSAA